MKLTNEELKKKIKNGVVVIDDNLEVDGHIDIEADLIVYGDIIARNILARNILAWDITARDITACNIKACNIKAWDISAIDITVRRITANDISYFAVCFAYRNISCKSIKGMSEKSKHFVLDGKIEVQE